VEITAQSARFVQNNRSEVTVVTLSTRKICTSGLLLLLLLASGCGAFSDSAKPRITFGEEHAAILRLPGGSNPSQAALADGHTRTHQWGSEVVFNLTRDSQRVLFRVMDPGTNGVHYPGDAVFALSLRGGFEIKRASEADWSGGVRISPPDRQERYALLREERATDDGHSFLFEGRERSSLTRA
jgi:hypothetical protein